jgi:23S rRNA pseudouridine1911/1915/1917 synthase
MELNTNSVSFTTYSFRVEAEFAGTRVDKFLSIIIPSYSRSFFQNCILAGTITINKTRAKASTTLRADDLVEVKIPIIAAETVGTPLHDDLGIETIFTHEHFFIISKPAHILVHETEKPSGQPTIVDWLATAHQDILEIGSAERPGIVHRLDKETSGLLIIARTNLAHKTFTALFKNREIKKTYLALVEGHPLATGTINSDIGRDPVHRKKMTAVDVHNATLSCTKPGRNLKPKTTRTALTHYAVKQYFDEYSLVEVMPQTGRTHQIRVHLSSIGHPLVGDHIYGKPSNLIARHALHAQSLSFEFQGQPFSFTKEIPDDFKGLIDRLPKS